MNIAVLGPDGVTGKAVVDCVKRLDGWQLVADVVNADWVVASPGISPDQYPPSAKLVMSEIEFAWRLFHREGSRYCPRIIGVTGTNGKSTVTALCAHVLACDVAGNIGVPLVTYVDQPGMSDVLVVELSSYQLESCSTFAPDVAMITNITPDHLSRHKTMNQYAQAKSRIFTAMDEEAPVYYVPDGAQLDALIAEFHGVKHPVCLPDHVIQTPMIGIHNQYNCAMVMGVAEWFGLDHATVQSRIESFSALPHRMESVCTKHGRHFINDSKGTNPDATLQAVLSCETPPHLILCGQDKRLDLAPFFAQLVSRVASITVYGGIASVVSDYFTSESIPFYNAAGLDDALSNIMHQSFEGDVVLFSPSSASFDLYTGFEHRGDAFREAVYALK
jgi:UDP-N-acetylmuramoylalanine--D-glutamate ligase